MEIYELPITSEESRNYHSFCFKLKALNWNDWLKAYATTLFCTILAFAAMMMFFEKQALIYWYETPLILKVGPVCFLFLISALHRSKSMQLRAMLQKYFINNLPQEFLGGSVQLKKIRVDKDKILVYYRKFKD